jgi:hypothetical protein
VDPCWSQTHYVGFVMTRLIFSRQLAINDLLYAQPITLVLHAHKVLFQSSIEKELFDRPQLIEL